MIVYHKLVRDKILKILKLKGVGHKYHIADDKEYNEKLYEKLQEEILEFKENPSAEEMADVMEVLNALGRFHNISQRKIGLKMYEKVHERGGFYSRIILESAEL